MMIHLILLIVNTLVLFGAITLLTVSQFAIMRAHHDISRLYSITMRRFQTGGQIIAAMDTVPINKHVRARMLFRDPWLLYPRIVRDAMANPTLIEPVPVEIGIGFGPPPEDQKPTLQ